MAKRTKKGEIRCVRTYHVNCATRGCASDWTTRYAGNGVQRSRPGELAAESDLASDGWERKRGKGWTCPTCVAGDGPVEGDERLL